MTEGLSTRPGPGAVPSPATVVDDGPAEPTGRVVWHREHLRVRDQPAVARAAEADAVLPVFVFDPAFYGDRGLACDSRVAFMHDCLTELSDRYHTATGHGLTYCHGDPVAVLDRFLDAGWEVVAADTPTGRHGETRDERARAAGVEFVADDGLVRDAERTRDGWAEHVEAWLEAQPRDPDLAGVAATRVDTDLSPERVADAYDVTPTKDLRPPGGTSEARERLEAFVEEVRDYPGNISSPLDAREGCSGLSPYLTFGCLSVRQVYRYVQEHAPSCRGREMFVSRLFWNRHYQQKLLDWSGWLDTAVNPVMEGFNADNHDPDLVRAWMDGETGFPMVDAAARCLRETGWLNFRMRAMLVSFYYHVLQQPWWIGADYFHEHLVDSEAGINYTQWQSQCGLVGKPSLRVYNPRKQVRDQDPEGEWIRRWVPDLADLPAEFLDRPEKTPPHVQAECGVEVGEDYPYPIVDFEAARQEWWDRFEAVKLEAAAALGDPEVAERASLSGGVEGAAEIAAEYGGTGDDGTQAALSAFTDDG